VVCGERFEVSQQSDLVSLVSILIKQLREKKWSLGFAESCTGGLLSTEVTKLPGVSDVFKGSVISYSNEVKKDLLAVKQETLDSVGAVSREVVLQMAAGARASLKVDVAVGISGVAGPTGGTSDKPVGLVWISGLGPNFEVAEKHNFKGSRVEIQKQAVEAAINLLIKKLKIEEKV
jgi:PncC family amidohydrolase